MCIIDLSLSVCDCYGSEQPNGKELERNKKITEGLLSLVLIGKR